MEKFERIYETLTGQILPQYREAGIPNAFEEGSLCSRIYDNVYEARCALEVRLGCDEDKDIAAIIEGMEKIAKELCRRLYLLAEEAAGRE